MTQKSQSRRARDAAARQAVGGRVASPKIQREKSARCWFELKNVHARTQNYIVQLAERLAQYRNPIILLKIAKNGDGETWNALHQELTAKAEVAAADLLTLWKAHEHKRNICTRSTELEEAIKLFEAYQVFDMDFYNTFSPIIDKLNEIFNKALKMLLDAKDELFKDTTEEARAKMIDPSVVSDVNYEMVKDKALPPAMTALAVPETGVPEAEDEPDDVDPKLGFGLIRPKF